jgi:hypothetical protein
VPTVQASDELEPDELELELEPDDELEPDEPE